MKTTCLFILIVLLTINGVAQQDSINKTPHSEIKVNAFNLIIYKAADVSYEYLLNENQSIGMGLLIKLKPLKAKERKLFEPEISYTRYFSLTPYYRYFLSKKYAKGIFIEGFAMYATGKEFESTPDSKDTMSIIIFKKYKTFRLGIGIGLKIVSRKNLSIDINFGYAMDPSRINYVSTNPATRGGISVGYRF
ncbi:hypothetical protein JBL43_07020 [Aureibaculum sp. A20]|uniref:DUF3575 domain-containing protein n=1 Tax=Aureibaculum flavum TaxID=2795986 RepID=A0ABS0WPU2_9FLAO|nr:DUF3575 domain-containing protein [Aureibaculum flavum]MBJ2173982.1 hypothetical protein [Aureibaculum flavum]